MSGSIDAIQNDVAELLRTLGLSDHARPVSPHAVVQDEILPAIRRLRDRCAEGYRAHACSFGALAKISLALPVAWAGEVDKYGDVVKEVEKMADRLARNVPTAHRLAMLALQSDRYAQDAEYRDAVDDVLAFSFPPVPAA